MNRTQNGFTMIEMIVLLTIVGTLAGLAAPSFLNFTRHQRICSETLQAASAMRLARARAVSHNANYMVDFEPMKNRYTLATIDHFAGVQDTTLIKVYKVDRRVHVQTPNFHGRHAVVFYPDGSASATGEVMFGDGREKCVLSTLQCTGRVALRFE